MASRSVTAVTEGVGQSRGSPQAGWNSGCIITGLLPLGVARVEVGTGRVSLAYSSDQWEQAWSTMPDWPMRAGLETYARLTDESWPGVLCLTYQWEQAWSNMQDSSGLWQPPLWPLYPLYSLLAWQNLTQMAHEKKLRFFLMFPPGFYMLVWTSCNLLEILFKSL